MPVALPSTLLFRVQSEHPDAILIAGSKELLASLSHRSALREVFSDIPAVMLAEQPGAALARSAARLGIYSVHSVRTLNAAAGLAAISATVAGFAVTLPLPPDLGRPSEVTEEDLTAREVEVLRLMARGYRT